MNDLPALFVASIDRFSALVDRIGAGDWAAPTPCTDWDVRALVNHVTSEQLWAPHLVAGETIEQVGDRYDGDVLGDDPSASWHAGLGPSKDAFRGADLDATVHLSYADVPCREYLTQMLTDAEVHGWDLATALGAPARLDPEVAELLLEVWTEQEELVRASGVFGNAVEVPGDADAATKLLGLLGRRA